MKHVLVTGANGHVGNVLARLLVEKGYRVRASVRDTSDAEKTRHLRELGLELVSADLMKPETLRAAAEGVDGVFQVAAVYQTHARDPQREIIEPSITGGMNMLRAAHAAGVKKVVFTSSIAAVGSDAPPDRPLTEEQWNDGARDAYFYAKTEAERRAWAFSKESGLKMVAINPGAVIGPGFYRHTPSTQAFEMLLRGKLPMVLPVGFTFVDVRDVASAHILAYENERATGRYLAVDRFCSMLELMALAREIDPKIKAPTRAAPVWSLPAIAFFDWMGNKVTGAPRLVTRGMVREMGGRYQRASSEKIRRELGWKPMDFKQSFSDTLNWIRERYIGGNGNGKEGSA